MDSALTPQEEKRKQRSMTFSVVMHIALVLLALLPLLTFPTPPPGQEGIMVNLGLPDQGQGDDNAAPAEMAEPDVSEPEPVEEEEVVPEPEPEPVREVTKPDPAPEKEVVKTEDPEALALKRKREKEKRERDAEERRKQEEEARERREAEAKRKAAEEAERKRAEEEARRNAEAAATKDKISGLFGDGKGKGNTGTSGNQGDPNGDPNAEALEGVSKGSGKVGGGLGSRGILSNPRVSENSQQQGTVVVEVCVDSDGDVISAEYTQRGSTTSNSQLRSAAIRNAKAWKFSKGGVDKQCGTITYNFRLQ